MRRFSSEFDYPVVQLDAREDGLDSLEIEMPNKCTITLFTSPENNESFNILKVVNNLKGKTIPNFLLIFLKGNSAIPKLDMPLFIINGDSKVISFRCPGTTESVKMVADSIKQSKYTLFFAIQITHCQYFNRSKRKRSGNK